MKKLLTLVKNHYTIAVEHKLAHSLDHNPTYFQALRLTLHDLLHYKNIVHKGGHLVYEEVNIPTIGMTYSRIIRIYVPPHLRGTGVASEMKDMVKGIMVLEGFTGDDGTKYQLVETTRLVRWSQ